MITKNFRLNTLANQYAAALYDHITTTNGGDYFMVDAGGVAVRVDIVGGVNGMRSLIDGYFLEAIKRSYSQWEDISIAMLTKCVNGSEITPKGREMWQSMTGDMGATMAGCGYAKH